MIGTKAPDFTLEGYLANNFISRTLSKDYYEKYVVLFFYPHDFSIICPKEILVYSSAKKIFDELSAEIIFISCDSKYVHKAWVDHDSTMGGVKGNLYPMLSDTDRAVSKKFNMLSSVSNVCCRGIVILDSDHEIRYYSVYDDKMMRNIDETVRVLRNIKKTDTDMGYV